MVQSSAALLEMAQKVIKDFFFFFCLDLCVYHPLTYIKCKSSANAELQAMSNVQTINNKHMRYIQKCIDATLEPCCFFVFLEWHQCGFVVIRTDHWARASSCLHTDYRARFN